MTLIIRPSELTAYAECKYRRQNRTDPSPLKTMKGEVLNAVVNMAKQPVDLDSDKDVMINDIVNKYSLECKLELKDRIKFVNGLNAAYQFITDLRKNKEVQIHQEVKLSREVFPTVWLQGTPDLMIIDGAGIQVCDFKCSTRSLRKKEGKADTWLQPLAYMAMAFNTYSQSGDQGMSYAYVVDHKTGKTEILAHSYYTKEQVTEKIKKLVQEYVLAKMLGDDTPTKCDACRYCPHKKTKCPLRNRQYI